MASAPARLGLSKGILGRRNSASAGTCSLCLSERQVLLDYERLSPRGVSPVRLFSQQASRRARIAARLRSALRRSKMKWYRLPVGLGIGFLGIMPFYKLSRRGEEQDCQLGDGASTPKKRPRIRPDGPWQVQVMSTLPLKAMSRLWGRFNELTVPYYLRVPSFRLYSYIFGVNLDEIEEEDLHNFPNLAAFFYRTLKPGARPLDPNQNALLSPSDGRILQFGRIEGGDIEQVKGMTYSLDALLGKHTPAPSISGGSSLSDSGILTPTPESRPREPGEEVVSPDEEFARVNDISYTLPTLLSGPGDSAEHQGHHHNRPCPGEPVPDQSIRSSSTTAVSQVQADLARGGEEDGCTGNGSNDMEDDSDDSTAWHQHLLATKSTSALYYAVIYLAPGDYHRFHSPTNWVVERRRHFAGELYSVSPYLQRTLPGLFTLNERVVLLGRWRWGFFSYVPVGATNVGSIVVNFDRELRTNSLTTDTAADRAAEEAAARGEVYAGFSEATYAGASSVLHGHALRRGEEMGGFQLGSTVVLVFEAPASSPAPANGQAPAGWHWLVEKGQRIKMGQALGLVYE